MTDSEKTTSPEAKKTRSVGLVVSKDGKFLLVRHEEAAGHLTGSNGLPSGRPESDDEDDIDAAVRELEEETGLIVRREDLFKFPGSYFEATLPRKDGTQVDFSWQVFKVVNFTGELRPSPETTPQWHSMEEIENLDREGKLLPNTIAAIEAAKINSQSV